VRAVTDLQKVSDVVRRRLSRMSLVLRMCPRADVDRRNATLTWALIELDNTIINLARHFLVSSLMCCRTASGARVTHSQAPMSQMDAAFFIMRVLEPRKYGRLAGTSLSRRDETAIRDPTKLMQVASAASLSNSGSVLAALSFPTRAFSEISRARHFFAHRNEQTAAAAISMALARGLSPPLQAWSVVDLPLPGQPYSLIEEWIYDVGQFQVLLTD
jgi:hypothetical protein